MKRVTQERDIVQAIGTVAHNRRFTAVELAECCGVPREWARSVIRKWMKDGLLESFGRHADGTWKTGPSSGLQYYFPTRAGWAIIEQSAIEVDHE